MYSNSGFTIASVVRPSTQHTVSNLAVNAERLFGGSLWRTGFRGFRGLGFTWASISALGYNAVMCRKNGILNGQ